MLGIRFQGVQFVSAASNVTGADHAAELLRDGFRAKGSPAEAYKAAPGRMSSMLGAKPQFVVVDGQHAKVYQAAHEVGAALAKFEDEFVKLKGSKGAVNPERNDVCQAARGFQARLVAMVQQALVKYPDVQDAI